MYAVIEVGARQYLIRKDDVIEVERQQVGIGKEIILDKVLMLSKDKKIEVGEPYLKDALVKAVVVSNDLGDKVISFKYRRRKGYHRKIGHRQQLTRLKIMELESRS